VAGAGPAGVAAAIVLRQAGLATALLDETDDDALKAGESLPGAVVRTLRRLGIQGIEDLLDPGERKPCVANVSAWGREEWVFTDALANPEGGGWHVLRHRFDAALRRRAFDLGVERVHAKVGDIESGEGRSGVTLPLSSPAGRGPLRARFVIDATGRHAAICRRQGVKRLRLSEQSAAVAWARHPGADQDDTTRLRSVEDGWWYTARLPGGLRVFAFHGLPGEVARLAKHPELFAERCTAAALLPWTLAAADLVRPPRVLDASVQVSESVAGPGWLAVGDAALSFDPLSSQGVLFALYSGISGAEAVLKCLARPDLALPALSDYDQRVQRVLASNQRARELFYTDEQRYPDSDYWSAQRQSFQTEAPPPARATGARDD
jgi:flavin-dependent dehydrogenase